jgi:hypothetical protein
MQVDPPRIPSGKSNKMRVCLDNPHSEVKEEASSWALLEGSKRQRARVDKTSNLVVGGAGGIPQQSTVEQVYQNWGEYMVGTEVYILFYLRTDHAHGPYMFLFVHE